MTTDQKPAKKAASASAKSAADSKANGAKGNPERNKAYQAATGKLREEYRDRFEALLEAECEARGVRYRRRLNPEEKARQQLDKLYAEFPHLRPNESAGEQPAGEQNPVGEWAGA